MTNPKISLDEATVKIIYEKYKLFLIPLGIILACVILFFTILMPQAEEFFSTESEVTLVREKIKILQGNINLLSQVDKVSQDENVQVVTSALPTEKDYAGIIGAVVSASSKSSVNVDDFSFTVGNVADAPTDVSINPAIGFTLNINGNMNSVRNFLDVLSKSFPLSEVHNVELNGRFATLNISFYYKALPLIQIDYTRPIKVLSKSESELLNTITSWQKSNGDVLF